MTKGKLLKLAMVLAIGLLFTTGCATVGTVMWSVNKPEFQKENQPIRTVRLAVYTNGFHSPESIFSTIEKASYELERQAGIRLKVVSFEPIKWDGTSIDDRLDKLEEVVKGHAGNFDMAIGFGWHSPLDLIMMNVMGTWMGVIDDTYRRYIVLKTTSTHTMTHEIAHAFIYTHGHSMTGLMQGMGFMLMPMTPPINNTIFLSPGDRREMLENKWRDFTVKPPLDDDNKSDLLKEEREEVKKRKYGAPRDADPAMIKSD